MLVIKGYVCGWPKFSITLGSKREPDISSANKVLKPYGYRIEKIGRQGDYDARNVSV